MAAGKEPVCLACPHAWHDHDQIAARYCAASASSGLNRGCVCPG
ncbi:RGCVC family protein [Crossiella sp. SN42]|nr:RGCVC family protein [Crossiella sp. SN42]MCO1581002.1 RGCVC family protein [Crossiella sp. SN42]